ncbi:MAG: hypothetical protein WAN43_14370 [Rhodomicrobium sp.]
MHYIHRLVKLGFALAQGRFDAALENEPRSIQMAQKVLSDPKISHSEGNEVWELFFPGGNNNAVEVRPE